MCSIRPRHDFEDSREHKSKCSNCPYVVQTDGNYTVQECHPNSKEADKAMRMVAVTTTADYCKYGDVLNACCEVVCIPGFWHWLRSFS